MLSAVGQSGFGLELEQTLGVLHITEESRCQKKAVGLYRTVDGVGISAVRLGCDKVGSKLCHDGTMLERYSQIAFRKAVLKRSDGLHHMGCGSFRFCIYRQILAQEQEAAGEGKAAFCPMRHNLRAAVEGTEGGAGLQICHVGKVCGHGMPGLADIQYQSLVFGGQPLQGDIGLTKTQLGDSVGR